MSRTCGRLERNGLERGKGGGRRKRRGGREMVRYVGLFVFFFFEKINCIHIGTYKDTTLVRIDNSIHHMHGIKPIGYKPSREAS